MSNHSDVVVCLGHDRSAPVSIQLPRTDRRLPMHLTACPWPVPTC